MKYINVINLDRYQPGYKDRDLIWIKVYIKLINGSYEFEMMHETDKWRFIALCMLQTQTKKPVPSDAAYLSKKGFVFKNRPLNLTLKALQNAQLVELVDVTETYSKSETSVDSCDDSVTQSREEKSREDKIRKEKIRVGFEELWKRYPNKDGRVQAENKYDTTVKTEEDLILINKALDNYLASDNVARGYIKNGSTWFNNWQDWIQDPKIDDATRKAREIGIKYGLKPNTNQKRP
jgi:hypothetical protein